MRFRTPNVKKARTVFGCKGENGFLRLANIGLSNTAIAQSVLLAGGVSCVALGLFLVFPPNWDEQECLAPFLSEIRFLTN